MKLLIATARNAGEARGGASLEETSLSRGDRRPESKRYVNSDAAPEGWLRTGANRLVPIPQSLLPWVGSASRSKFGENSRRLHAVRGAHR